MQELHCIQVYVLLVRPLTRSGLPLLFSSSPVSSSSTSSTSSISAGSISAWSLLLKETEEKDRRKGQPKHTKQTINMGPTTPGIFRIRPPVTDMPATSDGTKIDTI